MCKPKQHRDTPLPCNGLPRNRKGRHPWQDQSQIDWGKENCGTESHAGCRATVLFLEACTVVFSRSCTMVWRRNSPSSCELASETSSGCFLLLALRFVPRDVAHFLGARFCIIDGSVEPLLQPAKLSPDNHYVGHILS